MGKREIFISKAIEIHNDRYDYSKVEYVNNRTKVCIICPEHGEFYQLPKNHLHGQGCPECGKISAKQCHKHNYKEFLKSAELRFGNRYSFPHIENEYENSHSKITVICNLCGKTFTKTACDFITSQTGGCWCKEKECDFITQEELLKVIDGFKIKQFDGKKNKKTDKVIAICDVCGYKNTFRISSILNGKYSCKACAARNYWDGKRVTVETVKERMGRLFPTIKVDYTTYGGLMRNMDCECVECGHKFKRRPNTFFNMKAIRYSPCPKCTKEMVSKEKTKTTEEFVMQANNRYGEGKYEILGNYESSNRKIRIRCLDCGKSFDIEANSFLQGHGCPYHNCNSSKIEKEVADFIKTIYSGEIMNNNRSILEGKEIDIYLPEKYMAFEFDGVFWHNEMNKTKDFHLSKTVECEKQGVRLIHIFEDEWKHKQKIWKSMISYLLGRTEKLIYGRECEIRQIGKKECNDFLNENHLQGWCPSQIKYGLFHKDELVSVMTFGKSRHFIGNGKTEYELLRFCNKTGISVIGGASKLFKHFVSDYKPLSVVSYADRRWSNGKLYEHMGFTLDHMSKPNYYYVIGDVRKNRFNLRKSVLVKKYGCPENMSEHEFCKSKGWYRIYDCGSMVYKWFNNN